MSDPGDGVRGRERRRAYLEVLHGGLLTTVQDGGRPGYMASGLSPGGAMDRFLLACANLLVGNPPEAAALEFTLDGPALAVHGDVVAAVVAPEGQWRAGTSDSPLPLWEAVLLRDGSVVVVGAVTRGVRGYLAVAGGIDVPPVMGSRSTHVRARLGGFEGRALAEGDRLSVGEPVASLQELVGRRVPEPLRPHRHSAPIRVLLGPQDDAFTPRGLRTFLSSGYRVSPHSDRMGVRLQGPPVEARSGYEIDSEGVAAGSVQVPGDGQPILLLAERQATGGYAKIATVITADLDAAGQLRPGQVVRFLAVDEAAARRALEERRQRLDAIAAALGPSGGGGWARYFVAGERHVYRVERQAG